MVAIISGFVYIKQTTYNMLISQLGGFLLVIDRARLTVSHHSRVYAKLTGCWQ